MVRVSCRQDDRVIAGTARSSGLERKQVPPVRRRDGLAQAPPPGARSIFRMVSVISNVETRGAERSWSTGHPGFPRSTTTLTRVAQYRDRSRRQGRETSRPRGAVRGQEQLATHVGGVEPFVHPVDEEPVVVSPRRGARRTRVSPAAAAAAGRLRSIDQDTCPALVSDDVSMETANLAISLTFFTRRDRVRHCSRRRPQRARVSSRSSEVLPPSGSTSPRACSTSWCCTWCPSYPAPASVSSKAWMRLGTRERSRDDHA